MSCVGSFAPETTGRSFFVTRALIKIPCNNSLVLKVNDASEIQVLNEIDRLSTKGKQNLRKVFVSEEESRASGQTGDCFE